MGHVSQAHLVINLPVYALPAKAKIHVYCGFYFSSNPTSICEAEVQCMFYAVFNGGEDKHKEHEADSSIL